MSGVVRASRFSGEIGARPDTSTVSLIGRLNVKDQISSNAGTAQNAATQQQQHGDGICSTSFPRSEQGRCKHRAQRLGVLRTCRDSRVMDWLKQTSRDAALFSNMSAPGHLAVIGGFRRAKPLQKLERGQQRGGQAPQRAEQPPSAISLHLGRGSGARMRRVALMADGRWLEPARFKSACPPECRCSPSAPNRQHSPASPTATVRFFEDSVSVRIPPR
jgi:hypothetical protein